MRTAHLQPYPLRWPPDVSTGGGWGPQVNKFERGGRAGAGRDPMSDVLGEGGLGPCIVRSYTSWVMVSWGPPCGQTDMTKNITFPQLCWRAVKNILKKVECTAILLSFCTMSYQILYDFRNTASKIFVGVRTTRFCIIHVLIKQF